MYLHNKDLYIEIVVSKAQGKLTKDAKLMLELLAKKTIKNAVKTGTKTTIKKLFAGGNGMTLLFSCEDNVQYTVKFNFNLSDAWNVSNKKESWEGYLRKTISEFLNIKQFNSPYVMKAYKYFIFESKNKKFRCLIKK